MAWRDFWGRGAVLVLVVVLGAVWWGAVLRLVLLPERTGLVEGAVAAGGWGLSLLPVHVVSAAAAGVEPGRRRWRVGRTAGVDGGGAAGAVLSWAAEAWRRRAANGARGGAAKASRRRRSGGGSGPS